MARPLRLEFAGALYHVTARGNRREDIYLDDGDRELFLSILGNVCDRFNWAVHAYCLTTNHYQSYCQIWCMGIKPRSCLIDPVPVRRP